MPRHRRQLPQLSGRAFLTDGGLETDLIFHHGVDLPHFAAFTLAGHDAGRETLRGYYRRYLELAAATGRGIVLEAPTWRASRDWGALLGHSAETLREANREALALMVELRDQASGGTPPAVIQRLNAAVNEALKTPEVRSSIESTGGIVVGGTPEAYGKFLTAERAKWREVIKSANITLE